MIFSIVMLPIWTAVTDAYTKKDFVWLKNVLNKLVKSTVLFIILIIFMLLFSNNAYDIWIGGKLKVPFTLSVFMAFLSLLTIVVSPFSSFINGMGKLKLSIYVIIFKILIFIPLAIFLAKTELGVAGVVLAICIMSLISLVFEPIQVYKNLKGNAKGIWEE
jgi:O-antigen/teichoic acid export membrane protein